jgi:anti-sigma factor RsiW
MNDEDDDALLTGLVDGELGEERGDALRARLAAESELRARLEAIKAGGWPIAQAFHVLLDDAPLDRMKASLAALAPEAPVFSKWGSSARALAASVVVAAFVAGIGVGRLALHPAPDVGGVVEKAHEDWRDAVAEYAALYTRETFSRIPADDAAQRPELEVLGAKLGIDLAPERTKIDGLAFKEAILLAYDGAPLGQLAYGDSQGAPVLFCIIADARTDAAPVNETRKGFALTSWAHGGRGYMVIAQLPANKVAEIASQMERRF